MRKRLFIAINLPEDLRDRIEQFQQFLDKNNLPVRWLKNDSLHLTLKFLGELEQSDIAGLVGHLKKFFANYSSFELGTDHINAFPDWHGPRVIVLELTPLPALEKMAVDLHRLIKSLKIRIKLDQKPFRSHITIARVKHVRANWKVLKAERFVGQFNVNSVELMESELKPAGAEYRVIESFPLK